jgi:translation initiation factor 2 subunit 3
MAQAELNIMTAGHVDHGKTTLVYAVTNKWCDVHSEELKRGITIKMGYADFTIRKCPKCPGASAYTTEEKCAKCGSAAETVRKISFVDAPGHETLMATVIAASSIVDGALLVIAANEKCPQPQTAEHLTVLEIAGIKNVVIVQNKVDLVSKERAVESCNEIKALLKGTAYENAPIIPVAAVAKANVDALLQAIQEKIPTPKRNPEAVPKMWVARSFDVNKPGTEGEKLVGGVIGGSLVQGELKAGEEVEISPGAMRVKKDREDYEKLSTKIKSIYAEDEAVGEAGPGGLVGISTYLDPSLTRADGLVGCLVGRAGTLPEPKSELKVEPKAMPRVIEKFSEGFVSNEPLVLGVGTATTVGFVLESKKKVLKLKLKKPICVEAGQNLALMRRAKGRWHLYGLAKVLE